jgi:hypothetical protein
LFEKPVRLGLGLLGGDDEQEIAQELASLRPLSSCLAHLTPSPRSRRQRRDDVIYSTQP